ncbi:MAG: class I SAM-dependent methyltransferase [Thermoanaerobaculia bacterium]
MKLLRAAYRLPNFFVRHWIAAVELLIFCFASDETLDRMTAEDYRTDGKYRDDHHTLAGLYAWEERAITKHFPADGHLLVTSAGGGREVLDLVRRGHQVTATECVPELYRELCANVEKLAPRGSVETLFAAPDAVPERNAPFDGAVVGWAAYTHMIGRERRIEFLRAIHRGLRPGAPLLVSFWKRGGESRSVGVRRRVASVLRRILGRRPLEPGESMATFFYRRMYTPGEVEDELREAGYEIVATVIHGYAHVVARKS